MSAAAQEQAGTEPPPAISMRTAGERGLVVEMGKEISPRVNARVRRLAGWLSREGLVGLIEIVPAYCSLLIYFDPLLLSRPALSQAVTRILAAAAEPEVAEDEMVRLIQVPVCYGGEYGPDLADVARYHGLALEEVIAIHSAGPYLVYMLGFTPGFPYLGGLSEKIATPRLEAPRVRVAEGSVGIAGSQTGIYPIASPGGWRLIGRTPLKPFKPEAARPFLFCAGDYVQFNPVTPDRYRAIACEVAAGLYVPEVLTVSRERLGYDQGH